VRNAWAVGSTNKITDPLAAHGNGRRAPRRDSNAQPPRRSARHRLRRPPDGARPHRRRRVPGPRCRRRPYAGGALLSVDDRPPVNAAPTLGQVRVGGWVHRLDADQTSPARLEFAEANPVCELLDVGRGVALFAIEVDRAQVQRGVTIEEVDVEAFIEADADPPA
jgi:hypothetical protein